jgi:hypothetical protein
MHSTHGFKLKGENRMVQPESDGQDPVDFGWYTGQS